MSGFMIDVPSKYIENKYCLITSSSENTPYLRNLRFHPHT